MQAVRESDRMLLTDDMAVLTALPVLPTGPVGRLAQATEYRFGEELVLLGYALPGATTHGERIAFKFGWRVAENLEERLQQFLHLLRADDQTFYTYDRPLLGDIFPMTHWASMLEAVELWEVEVSTELRPGDYHVYTGLYDLNTLERRTILNTDPRILDNAIYLGDIHLD